VKTTFPQKESQYPVRYIFYLFLFALCFRILFYTLAREYPLLHVQSLDEKYYLDFGKAVADGFFKGESGAFFMDPLYGYFLGFIFFLFGENLIAVRAVQILLDAASAVLVFAIGRRVWDQQAGLIAGFIWATYTVAAYYSLLILKVTIAVTGMLLFILLVLKVIRNQRRIGFLGIGLAAGILVYIRANFFLVIPLTLIFYFFIERPKFRHFAVNAGFFLAGAMLLLSVNAVRNYTMIGQPDLLITSSGRILYCANNPDNTSGLYDVPSFSRSHPVASEKDFHHEAERRTGKTLSPREASRYWRNETLRVLHDNPQIIPVLFANKLKWTLANHEIPMNQSYRFVAEFSGTDKWPLPNYAFILALGLPGLAIGLCHRKQIWWLMIPIVTILATLMIFFVSSRFRMPMVPFLVIGTGIFLRSAWLWFKDGKKRNVVLPIFFAAVLFLVSMMIAPPEGDGHKEAVLARAFYSQNDYMNAKALALEAMNKDAGNVDLYILLGRITRHEGRTEQSMAYYQKAMSIAPDNFTVNYDLGMLYMAADKPESAIEHLEKSLAIRRYINGMFHLARAYEAAGEKTQAVHYYNQFLNRAKPDDPRRGFAQNRILSIIPYRNKNNS